MSGGTDSSILVSTRSGDLARFADEKRCFTVGLVTVKKAAQRIIERHAGVKSGVAKPLGKPGNQVSGRDEAEYGGVLALMLNLCDGWHLALGMCGALGRLMDYRWAEIGRKLGSQLLEMPSQFATELVQHPGLQAIIETNIEAARKELNSIAYVLRLSTASDRLAFELAD